MFGPASGTDGSSEKVAVARSNSGGCDSSVDPSLHAIHARLRFVSGHCRRLSAERLASGSQRALEPAVLLVARAGPLHSRAYALLGARSSSELVNFLVYLGALVAFDFFLRALIAHNHRQSERDDQAGFLRVPEWVWLLSGYSLFLWSALKWTTLHSDTPDLSTSVFVYLAAGILLRARCGADGWHSFLLLGVVLALAYLSKTALLPISLAFLAVGLLSTGNFRRSLPRVVVAGLVLAVVSAPFVAALSAHENRLTFGDAGKYMYVLFVNPGFPGDSLQSIGRETSDRRSSAYLSTLRARFMDHPRPLSSRRLSPAATLLGSTHRTGTLGSRSASISSARRGFSRRTCCSLGLRFLEYWLSGSSRPHQRTRSVLAFARGAESERDDVVRRPRALSPIFWRRTCR